MQIYHTDQQKAAWFESDSKVSKEIKMNEKIGLMNVLNGFNIC